MYRYLIGLLVGLIGGGAIVAMDLAHYNLATPLVGLAAGMVVGLALGWRQREPGKALTAGLIAGLLAGALLLVGEIVGASLYLRNPNAPMWTHLHLQRVYIWWFTGVTGVACLLLTTGLGTSVAGMASAWTGFTRLNRSAA